jgi:hypothetical protein
VLPLFLVSLEDGVLSWVDVPVRILTATISVLGPRAGEGFESSFATACIRGYFEDG